MSLPEEVSGELLSEIISELAALLQLIQEKNRTIEKYI